MGNSVLRDSLLNDSATCIRCQLVYATLLGTLLLTACGNNPTPPVSSTVGPLPTLQSVSFQPAGVPIESANGGKVSLLGILTGHESTVNRFDWTPDGKRLISTDGVGVAMVWELASGARAYQIQQNGLIACYSSADSNVLIGVGGDQQLYFLNAADGVQLSAAPTSMNVITATAKSPDRRLVAVGGRDGVIQIWDVQTRTAIFRLQAETLIQPTTTPEVLAAANTPSAPTMTVSVLAFSPDNTLLAAGLSDGSVRIWNTTTGTLQATLKELRAPVTQLAFSTTGNRLIAGAASTTFMYDAAAFTLIYSLIEDQSAPGRSLTIAPAGDYAAAVGTGDVAYVWQLGNPTIITIALPEQQGRTTALAFAPSGDYLVTTRSGDKGGAILWDVKSFASAQEGVRGRPINEFGNGIFAVSWSPDERWLAFADASGGIILWGVTG